MDDNYKPDKINDLRIGQNLEGIDPEHIYAGLDNIINNIVNKI